MSHEVAGRVVRRAGDTLYLSVTSRRALLVDEPAICALPLSGFVVMTPSVDIKGRQLVVLPTAIMLALGVLVIGYLSLAIPTWSF